MKKIRLILLFTIAFFCSHKSTLRAVNTDVSLRKLFSVITHDHCTESVINIAAFPQIEDCNCIFEEDDTISETVNKIKKRTGIDLNFIIPGQYSRLKRERLTITSVLFSKTSSEIVLLISVLRL
jgi:hypothetical protein